MLRIVSFLFGRWIYKLFSFIVKYILKVKGIKVGKHFYSDSFPIIIKNKHQSIIIGDNVTFIGTVELRTRENGKIYIKDGCKIDSGVRIIAANNANVNIGPNTGIGYYTVMNCGDDLTIGEKCLISGFNYFQCSNHGTKKGIPIKDQKQVYSPIFVGNDVWFGSHVSVLMGVSILDGAIIGAKAVVNKDVGENEIFAGVPAKLISERSA
jgi:acetyltransferase-like isoleucine patch superfamily enzyme